MDLQVDLLVKKIEDTAKKEMLIEYNKRYTMQSMSQDNLITQTYK
jgi:hypothetical protein